MVKEKIMSKSIFSNKDKERITEAVAALEKETSGELVLYYAKNSDTYLDAAWKLSGMIGILFATITIILSYAWLLPNYYTPIALACTILLAMLVTYSIARIFPLLRLASTNTKVVEHRVLTKARDMFLQEQVFNTVDRTGILVYISALERKVVVLGDSGINKKITQSDWEHVVKLVVNGIKTKNMTTGIIEAVDACKKLLLASGFIITSSDSNELPDAIRVED